MAEPPILPAIASAPLSVVLLARDDEAHLEEVVESWLTHGNKLQREWELLIADAGSTDRTREKAKALAKRHAVVRLLVPEKDRGTGAALRAGLAAARHPLVVYAPCDRQYVAGELKLLLAEIDTVHLVCGYRRWRPVPRWLRVAGKAWRGLARLLFSITLEPLPGWLGWKGHLHARLLRWFFGVRLRDVGCEYRLLRRSLLARIPIQSGSRFAHDELLAKANFLGAMMTDVPVSFRPRPGRRAAGEVGRVLADARRVFSRPDFGPAVLPGGAEGAIP